MCVSLIIPSERSLTQEWTYFAIPFTGSSKQPQLNKILFRNKTEKRTIQNSVKCFLLMKRGMHSERVTQESKVWAMPYLLKLDH